MNTKLDTYSYTKTKIPRHITNPLNFRRNTTNNFFNITIRCTRTTKQRVLHLWKRTTRIANLKGIHSEIIRMVRIRTVTTSVSAPLHRRSEWRHPGATIATKSARSTYAGIDFTALPRSVPIFSLSTFGVSEQHALGWGMEIQSNQMYLCSSVEYFVNIRVELSISLTFQSS